MCMWMCLGRVARVRDDVTASVLEVAVGLVAVVRGAASPRALAHDEVIIAWNSRS